MAENKTISDARFSLIVTGDELDVPMIEEALDLRATRIIRKGSVLARIPSPVLAGADEWDHDVVLTATRSADTHLNALLEQLISRKDQLEALRSRYDVVIRLTVRSDYAQMGYSLEPLTLVHLCALGMPLDVSTFSWGGLNI